MNALAPFACLLFATSIASQIQLPPADLSPGQPYRVLTITHGARNATSAQIADYDAFVRADIVSRPLANLRTNWRALASTPSISARVHTETDPTPPGATGVPIYRPDGTLLATDYDDLWDGSLLASSLASGVLVLPVELWTGTDANGSGLAELGNRSGLSLVGDPRHDAQTWVQGFPAPHGLARSFYAISDVITASVGDQSVRHGAPANPEAFVPTPLPPAIGRTWEPHLDHTSFVPSATVDFMILGFTQENLSWPPFGTLLVGATIGTLTTNPGQPFSLPIGDEASLVGLPLTAQAGSLDAAMRVQLTNAIDVVVGD